MDIKNLKPGELPDKLNVYIEIPQGSSIKYELDKESGFIFVDRFVYGSMFYPCNYGFVPGTHAEDGDPLDVLVLSSQSVQAGTVIPSRIIGMLEMEDEEGIDTKIIAVPTKKIDPFMAEIESVDDLPKTTKERIKNFFDRYKDLEPNKWVKTRDFLGKDKAVEAVKKAMQ